MKNIAIITGGLPHLKKKSFESALFIRSKLQNDDTNIHIIETDGKKWELKGSQFTGAKINLTDFSLKANNFSKTKFDCAINMFPGSYGTDGSLAGYFKMLDIPVLSSGVFASALSNNKYRLHIFLRNYHINTPRSYLLKKEEKEKNLLLVVEQIGLPCIVKPNTGSLGTKVTFVNNSSQLRHAISQAHSVSDEVVVEQYIEGTQITCGLVKTQQEEIVFPMTEIKSTSPVKTPDIYEEDNKPEIITPANVEENIDFECKSIASRIYDALNCFGIVRTDMIISKDEVFVIDVNTIPLIIDEGIIANQLHVLRLNIETLYKKLLDELIDKE
jgi:D-alanine-D-alanine ligase